MAITASERDILLKRLEAARVAKVAKAEAAKAAKAAKEAPVPAPTPAPVPEPAPTPAPEPIPIPEPAPVSQEIQSPPGRPIPIPEAPKKKQAKKVCLPISSDEEEEEEKPKKKAKAPISKKEPRYLKIVLYKEPSNPVAFQQLLESVNDNGGEYEDEPAPEPPAPAPFARPPRVLHSNQKQSVRPMVGADRKFEDARAAAMAFFS